MLARIAYVFVAVFAAILIWVHVRRHTVAVVYLDCNATVPMSDLALSVYKTAAKFANPASSYAPGRLANAYLESARAQLASMLGANRGRIVFTSGGSESNNSVIQSFSRYGRVLVSGSEHASVADVDVSTTDTIPVRGDGLVDIDALKHLVHGHSLVCVIFANNEVGTINDIRAVSDICRAAGVHCHVDAVQAVGKIRVDFDLLGADSYAVSAHKFGGPRGVGLTYFRIPGAAKSLIRGGKQENRLRAGTSNVAGVCSMAAALRESMPYVDAPRLHIREWVRSQLTAEGGTILGHADRCLPQTVSAAFDGIDSRELMHDLDAKRVVINVGSACSMGGRSRVLTNMGVSESLERGVIRVSWCGATPEHDVVRGVSVILRCVRDRKEGACVRSSKFSRGT